jgi:hypothetical protein
MFSLWPLSAQTPIIQKTETPELIIIGQNSVLAVQTHFGPSKTFGTLYETNRAIKDRVREVFADNPIMVEVIRCESNFHPEVCSYKGCQAGMGLIQVIPSSLKLCEAEVGRKLNPFNTEDNLLCGKILYKIQGLKAWDSSRQCWSKNYDRK